MCWQGCSFGGAFFTKYGTRSANLRVKRSFLKGDPIDLLIRPALTLSYKEIVGYAVRLTRRLRGGCLQVVHYIELAEAAISRLVRA